MNILFLFITSLTFLMASPEGGWVVGSTAQMLLTESALNTLSSLPPAPPIPEQNTVWNPHQLRSAAARVQGGKLKQWLFALGSLMAVISLTFFVVNCYAAWNSGTSSQQAAVNERRLAAKLSKASADEVLLLLQWCIHRKKSARITASERVNGYFDLVFRMCR